MANEVLVRVAQENDVLDIFEICHMAFAKYARESGHPEKVTALRELPNDILRDLHTKTVLVAELGGVPVGSVRYEDLGNGLGYLSRFGVRPDCQRTGIGKALVHAVEVGCREMGLRAIALHTSSRMTNLVRFYYAAGYFIHSIGTDRGYYRALFVRELAGDNNFDLSALEAQKD